MTISDIQDYLKKTRFDAYIITRNNMFIGQDVLESENKIQELSGFSGSAGNMIVFQDHAVLLVDGRYDIQAKAQVNTDVIEVVCTRETIANWISHNVSKPSKFLYDDRCHSVSEVDYWSRALGQHSFSNDENQLLGTRVDDRQADIFELEEKYAGVTSEEKIAEFCSYLQQNNLDSYLLCESDSVSWLMNLRSDLIQYSPMLRAYALVYANGNISLFTNDFSKLFAELKSQKGQQIGINFARTPKKIQNIIKQSGAFYRNITNPLVDMKAIKNPIEISGFKECHRRDGIALCRFLSWLDQNYNTTDELGCVDKLHEFRRQGENFYSESFATIAGFASNGAIIHYQPSIETNKQLCEGSMLLLDSGGHYFDGTTDVTRTVAIGKPLPAMIADYTTVLKSHIALSSQIFPKGTFGCQLDAIARFPIWNRQKNYAHGTGHGVGHCLNVHEGPQSISSTNHVALQAGMICSIEPGFYLEGEYGIRIENLALVVAINDEWLKFEPLTMVPYDRNLIDKSMLSDDEISWINNYHQNILQQLSGEVDAATAAWLKNKTAPL